MKSGAKLNLLGIAAAICLVAATQCFAGDGSKAPVQVPPGQAEQIGKGEAFQSDPAANMKRKGPESAANDQPTGGSAKPPSDKIVDRLTAEIRDALELRKTLVVWLVEQSPQAAETARNARTQIERIAREASASAEHTLATAVIAYGAEIKLLTLQPIEDSAKLNAVLADLQSVKPGDADKSLAVEAFREATGKFLSFRDQGYEVIFIVAGASSDDDSKSADEVVAALKRAMVPVFGIGPAVAMGEPPKIAPRKGMAPEAAAARSRAIESLYPERIQLALFDRQGTADLSDSGYGPFLLERICRASGGKFLRVRSGALNGWDTDPTTGDVKPELLAKYAPDYVNEDQYKKLLAGNKCRMALHNAAMLPPLSGLDGLVKIDFPKQKDEAKLAQDLKRAQQPAAEKDQPVQELYETLAPGEADRAKLTGARWQVEYDLAMGLAMAAKARLDGYNTILATLKQGKNFANAESKRWVLVPADELAAASTIDKMVKTSRMYLERVANEHKGTPWATIAQRELKHPAGWKLTEE
jgi:hypothetical protein